MPGTVPGADTEVSVVLCVVLFSFGDWCARVLRGNKNLSSILV